MSKPDYRRKAEVIANGDYDMFRKSLQAQSYFFKGRPIPTSNPFSSVKEAVEYNNRKLSENRENHLECERLENARCHRVVRLKKRIRYMLENFECCFVTLTFTDDVLARTSSDTRHQYVKKWLRDNFSCAVANIDFGSKNGREHYHAVVPVPRVKHDTWSYGALYGKSIAKGDKVSADKLACYTAKLVNHAIKETTKGCRTIYSGSYGDSSFTLERSKSKLKPVNSKPDMFMPNPSDMPSEEFIAISDDDMKRFDEMFLKGYGF